ncbi:MAG: hypothetical protein ABIZ80_01700, partial [Bryobacteraceae bacterium]
MPKPQLVCRRPGTPPDPAISRGQLTAIPYDLLRDASRRLGIMSLLGAAPLGYRNRRVSLRRARMIQGDQRWLKPDGTDVIAIVSIVLSVLLFFYTRREEQNPRFILDLGVIYLVLTSFALGLVFHWDAVPAGAFVSPMITGIGPVVVMFAAIVPSAPVKILVAGFLSVSMNPLAMMIAKWRGTWDFGPTSNVLLTHYPDYLLAAVAVVISHVVTKIGRQVTEAREMGSYELVTMLGKGG